MALSEQALKGILAGSKTRNKNFAATYQSAGGDSRSQQQQDAAKKKKKKDEESNSLTDVISGLADFGKGVVSGIQQGAGHVADVALEGGALLGSIGQSDKTVQEQMRNTERLRQKIHGMADISGNKIEGTTGVDQAAGRIASGKGSGRDFASVGGKALETGLDATQFINPAAAVGKEVLLQGGKQAFKQVAKSIAKEAAVQGSGNAVATGSQVYGQTGDIGQASIEGVKSGLLSATTQGALGLAGHAAGRGVRKLRDINKKAEAVAKNDPQYLKDNNLTPDPQVDPARQQAHEEAATAVAQAEDAIKQINDHKTSSPYHRAVDKIDSAKQAEIQQVISSAEQNGMPDSTVNNVLKQIDEKYRPEYDKLAQKFPEDAAMKPEIDAQEQQAVQAHMEAQSNLDKMVQEDQATAASAPIEADPEKLKAHQADLEAQKQQIVAEANDRASYPARDASEANAKIEDITDPDLNPGNVDANGNIKPEAAKKIQAAQVERAQASVDNPSGNGSFDPENAIPEKRYVLNIGGKEETLTLSDMEDRAFELNSIPKNDRSIAQQDRLNILSDNIKRLRNKEKLSSPTTGKTAPNATYARLMGDENIGKDVKGHITNLTHQVHSDKILSKSAGDLVKGDVEAATELFNSEDLLSHNPDSQIILGNKLVDAFNAADRPDLAGQVYDKMLETSTTAGRGLRAVGKISKVSPQGIVKYAEKVADQKGKTLPPEKVKGLQDAAKAITKMEDGPAKEAAVRQLLDDAEDRGIWDKMQNIAGGILSLPRTLMTSADFSYGLRQGAILGARYPKIWAKAQGMSARMAVDENYFKEAMQHIEESTDKNGEALLPIYKKMGLAIEGVFGRSEETFGNTSIAEGKLAKKLVVGHIVAGSDRAFSGAATVMRSDVAKKIINDYGGVAEVSKWNSKALKDLGRVIDTATGRGSGAKGGWFEKAAPTLGQTLFSARLWKSRLDTLNPVYYARLSPPARKVALQSAASFASVATAVLAAAAASGAEVETDPRSTDFGKIKVGDTRYDILGGLQQNIVLAARELTGQTKSSTTGDITNLGETAFGPDRLSLLGDFVQNKESPIVSTGSTILKGTDRMGNIVNPWNEIAKLFIPLGIQDTASATSANNGDVLKGAAQASPGFFGVGVNTYGPNQDTKSINIADKPKVDAAPVGEEDQYNAFYGAAKNVTGHKKASSEVTRLFQDHQPEKARRKAQEFNDKVDEIMAGFYAQYPDMDQDLRDELNKNMYITLNKRSEAQRASTK